MITINNTHNTISTGKGILPQNLKIHEPYFQNTKTSRNKVSCEDSACGRSGVREGNILTGFSYSGNVNLWFVMKTDRFKLFNSESVKSKIDIFFFKINKLGTIKKQTAPQ